MWNITGFRKFVKIIKQVWCQYIITLLHHFEKSILNNVSLHRSHTPTVKVYKMLGRYSLGRQESICTMRTQRFGVVLLFMKNTSLHQVIVVKFLSWEVLIVSSVKHNRDLVWVELQRQPCPSRMIQVLRKKLSLPISWAVFLLKVVTLMLRRSWCVCIDSLSCSSASTKLSWDSFL